jgi:poly(hydroxyalkanoate) depolymerase family esterase
MQGLGDTIRRRGGRGGPPHQAKSDRLAALEGFGANPGNLAGYYRMPAIAAGAPLVVVLHGCTQSAASYDAGTGWSRLADKYGFGVLFPEQKRENNPNLCFNWFEPGDIRRGQGEVHSIMEMVDALIGRHGLSPDRVFVTGLSAGGAMSVALLATYAERFAGGAIIAGLPFAGATGVAQAFERMQGKLVDRPGALEKLVLEASEHRGPWPTLSLWQGTADHVVSPKNVLAIADQWRGLHQLSPDATRSELVNGYPRSTWTNRLGIDVLEVYSITGMGHGAPIGQPGPNEHGAQGAHIIETRISSTLAIASFWRIIDVPAQADLDPAASGLRQDADQASASPRSSQANAGAEAKSDIQAVIEKALRAAGLMK